MRFGPKIKEKTKDVKNLKIKDFKKSKSKKKDLKKLNSSNQIHFSKSKISFSESVENGADDNRNKDDCNETGR